MVQEKEIKERGCPTDSIPNVSKALQNGVSWSQILLALEQFGEDVWAMISTLFPVSAPPPPAPAPDCGKKSS